MTDYDRLILFLGRAGVEFVIKKQDDGGEIVICDEGMKKVAGYMDFQVLFSFDKEGNL